MTRKDFILIADICVSTIKAGFMHDPDQYIEHVAQHISRTNPNFDFTKFRKYILKKL